MADPDRPTQDGHGSPAEGGKRGDAFDDLQRRRADESTAQQMFALSGVGFEFIAAVAALTAIGWWLDRQFETSPWLTLLGVALGFTVGLVILVRFGKRGMK